jgi:MFS family permease
MLHKTLIILTAAAALGVGSTAIARQGGMGGMSPTMQGSRMSAMGPTMHGSGMVTAPTTGGSVQGWGGRTFSRNNFAWRFHDHFHHRFHHRHLFAFGFVGPLYDSCWRLVRTYYGWRRVYVCGDYPYSGY